MAKVCILTDSSVQFTRPAFPGRAQVYTVPSSIRPLAAQPRSRPPTGTPEARFVLPNAETFSSHFDRLEQDYEQILVIAHAASLGPAVRCAAEAAAQRTNHGVIQVVDSQTTAIGLGLLVQMAAEAASAGASIHEIERLVRAAIPRVYMLICIPEMGYLAGAGYLSRAQAVVGEIMGLLPIFVLEEGRLTPMLKVRTQRHLLESIQEFIDEFTDPGYVALVQGTNHMRLRSRTLREYVAGSFPGAPFSVHAIGDFLAALFGPQCVALVVMEKSSSRSK